MTYTNSAVAPYAKVAAKLLQGPVFEDQADLWEDLIRYQVEITRYFEQIALELIIDSRDGYSYLKQMELDDNGSTIGLVRRIPLSYELSLVCVLLREWLEEFELGDLDAARLYITPKQFRDRMDMFFQEKTNELKFIKELNNHLEACEKMGFLKLVFKESLDKDDYRYEVRRILKARITNDELAHFKTQLEEDVQSL